MKSTVGELEILREVLNHLANGHGGSHHCNLSGAAYV